MTDTPDPLERIAAALADSPDVAVALVTWLETLAAFQRAAAAVVESVEDKPIWVPRLQAFPPTQGSA